MINTLIQKFKLLVSKKEDSVDNLSMLNSLGREVSNRIRKNSETKCKVLIGPSFSVYEPALIHDRLLSYSLKLKGAEIIPIFCDSIQTVECNVSGGVWKDGTFAEACKNCMKCSNQLWEDNEIPPVRLSDFLIPEDHISVSQDLDALGVEDWVEYSDRNLPFGQWAKDILVNNYVVGDFHLVPDSHILGVNHIRNLKLLEKSYSRILDHYKPDRVVSNDSYYGMWAILQALCQERKIPFYSHWGPVVKGRWAYAYNDASMNLNFTKPWPKLKQTPLTREQSQKVEDWINKRNEGKEMIIDTASLSKFKTDDYDLSKIDFNKPTALLTANVIWDLAALNKQTVFEDMIDWIAQTIKWFEKFPQYQLIVKPHPAELYPAIPETKERVDVALAARGVAIPDNVFLFTPKVKLTIYDLLPLIKVCLVHTTTVGIEAAAIGLPVITTAKSLYRGFGFTYDPATPDEYFNDINNILLNGSSTDLSVQKDLAYKFILFYQFHYYTLTDLMEFEWGNRPKLKTQTLQNFFTGRNEAWDFVTDTILSGLPIVDTERWIPES